MIRLRKLTDYGFVLLTHFANADNSTWLTARDLAEQTGLPLPTVSKLLKVFSKRGILAAHRGVHGGYRLSKPAGSINVADIIDAIDGPLAATDCACSDSGREPCVIEENCPTKPHWIRITKKIRSALTEISLLELAGSVNVSPETLGRQACTTGCDSKPRKQCTCRDHDLDLSGDRK